MQLTVLGLGLVTRDVSTILHLWKKGLSRINTFTLAVKICFWCAGIAMFDVGATVFAASGYCNVILKR